MLLQLPHFSLGPLHCYSALGLIESARGLILVLVCLEHCIWIYSLCSNVLVLEYSYALTLLC